MAWESARAPLLRSLKGHGHAVHAVAVSLPLSRIVSGSAGPVLPCEFATTPHERERKNARHSIIFWDLSTGAPDHTREVKLTNHISLLGTPSQRQFSSTRPTPSMCTRTRVRSRLRGPLTPQTLKSSKPSSSSSSSSLSSSPSPSGVRRCDLDRSLPGWPLRGERRHG